MELLERGETLDALERLLADAARGHGRLVMLAGEAGVGKTALVTRFCQQQHHDARVLSGACDPLATPRPLGPIVDIASAVGGSLDRVVQSNGTRDQVLASFLGELSRGTKANVVIFEDVHWADDATLDALRFLGRRIGSTRTLAIATYRNDDLAADHPLSVMLGDLATSPDLKRLELQPLTEAAVRQLAKGKHADPAGLYQATGGNPFYVTEVLAAGIAGIPATVRDAVLARASRMSAPARKMLESAAVLGARSDLSLLLSVAGPAKDSIDECIATGMLVSEGAEVHFRHELARNALLEGIPRHTRTSLHRAALAALRERSVRPDDFATLAYHAEAAGDARAVLEFAPAAAARAARLRSHREAAAQYGRTLRFADTLPSEQRAALLEARSYECYLTDQEKEATHARRAALDIWHELGNQMKIGENLRWLSRLAFFAGDKAEAERTGRAALQTLQALPPGRQLAWAYSNMSQLRMLSSDEDEAIAWGKKALALAESLGETEIIVHALNNIGAAKGRPGEDGGPELEQSLELALAAGLEEHVARAYVNLNWGLTTVRQFGKAEECFHEGLAYCTGHDLDAWRIYLLGQRSWALLHAGRWSEATDIAAEALARPSLSLVNRHMPLLTLAWVRLRRGDPEVWPLLDEALELARPTLELQHEGPVRVARAEAAYLAGDPSRAGEEARRGLELARGRQNAWLVGELASWLWRSGGKVEPSVEIAEAYALEIAGNWRRAAGLWKTLSSPYEMAWALAGGDDETSLRQAHAEFERLGARPSANIVARRLRSLGVREIPRGPHASTRGNPFHLTQREVEVLELIGSGLRNNEIAARLFLTPKTVDHHVSSILAKLGVHSRMRAAQLLKDGVTAREI